MMMRTYTACHLKSRDVTSDGDDTMIHGYVDTCMAWEASAKGKSHSAFMIFNSLQKYKSKQPN